MALAVLAALSRGALAQMPAPDPLEPLAPLVGRGEGTSEGQPGTGKVHREYARILNGRFIRAMNRSVYPPQDKNPKGETHEDFAVFSYDQGRKLAVLRQFHVEGFVNQYTSGLAVVGGRIVFTSEAIENIPAGFRARETYTIADPDHFEELFELAEPGKPFAVYSRSRFTRAR